MHNPIGFLASYHLSKVCHKKYQTRDSLAYILPCDQEAISQCMQSYSSEISVLMLLFFQMIVVHQRYLEKGHSLEGSTLYCSLEPCSFKGRTPSCAEAIARVGIQRVVAAIRDPHPKVNGNGFRILKEAGIEVIEGPGTQEAEASLKEWLDGDRL